MASIQKRPDGAWRARYRDAAGKEHARHFKRKTDAQRWLDEVTASVVTGSYVAPRAGRITFKEYAEDWRKVQVFRPSTAALVELALTKRVYPVLGARRLDSITPSHIQALVATLNLTYAPRTVSVTYSYVSSVFKDAVRNRRIARTPCEGIKLPKIEKTRVEPLSTKTVFAIADAMPDHLRALVIVAAGTGLRQGELFGLTVDRVNFLKRTITVDRQLVGIPGSTDFGPTKTASSNREVPLPSSVALLLSQRMKEQRITDGLLFLGGRGAPLTRSGFGEVWRRATVKAKVPDVNFHELRHHYASVLIESGASVKTVQANLGHKSAEETLNTYAHLWPDADDKTRVAIDAAFANPADSLRTSTAANGSAP